MTHPIAQAEPSCFCHVDGCWPAVLKLLIRCGESDPVREAGLSVSQIGGAKMAVGVEAALCELLASSMSPGTFITPWLT